MSSMEAASKKTKLDPFSAHTRNREKIHLHGVKFLCFFQTFLNCHTVESFFLCFCSLTSLALLALLSLFSQYTLIRIKKRQDKQIKGTPGKGQNYINITKEIGKAL